MSNASVTFEIPGLAGMAELAAEFEERMNIVRAYNRDLEIENKELRAKLSECTCQ